MTIRAIDLDPTGEKHGGMPTYPYGLGPDGYLTRRQLRARGLRPNSQDVAAQIVWRRGGRVAHLFAVAGAAPVRPMTPARWRAHERMMLARRTCPECRRDAGYVIPTHRGNCNVCAGIVPESGDWPNWSEGSQF